MDIEDDGYETEPFMADSQAQHLQRMELMRLRVLAAKIRELRDALDEIDHYTERLANDLEGHDGGS